MTLFASCWVLAYIRAKSVLKKLDIPNYEFGKGQCAFHPVQSYFAGKNKVHEIYQNFIFIFILQTVSTNQKFQNSNIISEGFRLPVTEYVQIGKKGIFVAFLD